MSLSATDRTFSLPDPRRQNTIMPPKKKQYNGFYYFMLDFRKREEDNGQTFKNMEEVSSAAGVEWQTMDLTERAPYDGKARQMKNQAKGVKYTSTGEKVEAFEKREQDEISMKKTMEKDIENIVSGGKDFSTKQFFVAHVNEYCFNSSTSIYVPAEISIAHFSLQDGVNKDDVFHVILDSVLPIGYRHAALQRSNESHGIPVPPHEEPFTELSKRDMSAVMLDIIKFLSKFGENKLPPVYVIDSNTEEAKTGFQYLLSELNYDENSIKIYSLSYLFYVIRNAAFARKNGDSGPSNAEPIGSTAIISYPVIERELQRDIYSHTMDIACTYHNVSDQFSHCSMSYVIRNIYTICDHTCEDLGIKLKLGYHVPVNSIMDAKQRPSTRPVDTKPAARSTSSLSQASTTSTNRTFRSASTASVASVIENSWKPVLRRPNTMSIAASFSANFPALGDTVGVKGRGRGTSKSTGNEPEPGVGASTVKIGSGRGRGISTTPATDQPRLGVNDVNCKPKSNNDNGTVRGREDDSISVRMVNK
ncbi:maelstrom [Carabus blaptoides fortunei]